MSKQLRFDNWVERTQIKHVYFAARADILLHQRTCEAQKNLSQIARVCVVSMVTRATAVYGAENKPPRRDCYQLALHTSYRYRYR